MGMTTSWRITFVTVAALSAMQLVALHNFLGWVLLAMTLTSVVVALRSTKRGGDRHTDADAHRDG
jgi:uncharacterized membrane protein